MEITIKDIEEAMKLIEKTPEKVMFKDEYQIIKGRHGLPTSVQFTKKGVNVLEQFTGIKFKGSDNQGMKK